MKSKAIITDREYQNLSAGSVFDIKGHEVELKSHRSLDPTKHVFSVLSKLKPKLNSFENTIKATALKVLKKDGYNKFDQFHLIGIYLLPDRVILKYHTYHKAAYSDDLIPYLVFDKSGTRIMEKSVLYGKDGSIQIKETSELFNSVALGIIYART